MLLAACAVVVESVGDMFPPYVVKFPHTNTGVVPFLYPGYSRLLSSGFPSSHLPITGTKHMHMQC